VGKQIWGEVAGFIQFIQSYEYERIYEYNKELTRSRIKLVADSYVTRRFPVAPDVDSQYTPPTPTWRNCRVESRRRRRCEHNSQLAHDYCRRVRSHRRHNATRLAVGKYVQTRRNCRHLVAKSVHTADATHLNSLRRVGDVYWALL